MAEYNPDEHKAADVVDKIESVSPEEAAKIAAAEKAGKARKSVLEAAGVDPNERTDASGRVLLAHEVSPENQAGGHAYSE